MSALGKERKIERMRAYVEPGAIVSDRTYNLVMGGTVLYGLVVNIILCLLVDNVFFYVAPIPFFIGYIICTILGITISAKSDNPAISFLGYNLVVLPMGLMLTSVLYTFGGVTSPVVLSALYYTALITAIMVLAAMVYPNVFARMGGVLFACLIGLIFAGIIGIFIPGISGVTSMLGAVIFSLYIGYDFYRSQQYPKTVDNAVDCAVDIYIDIINLFIRVLEIVGRRD